MKRVVALLAAAGVAGCGVSDPYTASAPRSRRPTAVDTPRPTAPLPHPHRVLAGPQPTPRAVIEAFAEAWCNWSWRSVSRQQRQLAALADGPYADQLRADARHATLDRTLLRAQPEQSGTVVTVAVRQRARTASAVVVTREKSFTHGAEDAGGARYRVYLARARRARPGWLVRSWRPQP